MEAFHPGAVYYNCLVGRNDPLRLAIAPEGAVYADRKFLGVSAPLR